MEHLYGEFSKEQLEEQKVEIHKKIHFLLRHEDPNSVERYPNVDFDVYFVNLMIRLSGLNSLLKEPTEMVTLLSLLQAAYLETKKEDFDFRRFRKLILDAHSVVDKIKVGE